MAKPKRGEAAEVFGVRLPKSLVARLDAWAERTNASMPGLDLTRADAVRVLLTRALDADEGARK